MRKFAAVLVYFVVTLSVKQVAHAQNYLYATGNPTFSTQIPIENGFINVNNGDIHIEIPLAIQTQRGTLQLDEKLVYDSRIWKIVQSSGYKWQPRNVPNSMGGWTFSPGSGTGSIAFGTYSSSVNCNSGNPAYGQFSYADYWYWTWTDPQGTVHPFPSVSTIRYTGGTNAHCLTLPTGTHRAAL